MKQLLLATHNTGKIQEFKALLAPLNIEILSAADYRLIEPAETGVTFEENAAIKAVAGMKATGLPSLADDSGICVPALKDAPGVYTADWAGVPRNWMNAMGRVHDEIGASTDRRAYFVSLLALCLPNGDMKYFRGEVWGELVWPVRGAQGFGFDPMFKPDGHDQTFAEMKPELKNKLSHRAKALDQLLLWLRTQADH
jgi:XTP/dITP diphosphohydrolase